MECQSSLDPAVLSGFTGIPEADLQNFDLPDFDFGAYLNLDPAETDTDMGDCDGRLSLPGRAPLLSGEPHEAKSMRDPVAASYAWTSGNIVESQLNPANKQLTAPQALMKEYQTMYPRTQGYAITPQPIPGVIYDNQGYVISPAKVGKQCASRWVPCPPPSQLLNTQVGPQSRLMDAGGYVPRHPAKQILPYAQGHLLSVAPQKGNPVLTQSIRGSDFGAAIGMQGQVNNLPMVYPAEADDEYPVPRFVAINHLANPKFSAEADGEYPVPQFVAINHQPNPKLPTKSLIAKSPTKPRLRNPPLTKPNPRYAPHPKYARLRNPPLSWSIYTYTSHGELTPSRLYKPLELTAYFFAHPRPDNLTLRIHRNAPDSRHRYPTTHSHRCRFVTCPMYPNNTINQGHIGVSISEDGDEQRDPFLVAAWVHLWCLERFTDFVRVCRELNVEADTRDLPWEKRGKNPFQLATAQEEKCVKGFIRACRSSAGGGPLDSYPHFDMPNRPHEGTLTHRLACIKLKREPTGVAKQRELREQVAGYRGSTLDVHMGDLEVERRVRGWTRKHGNQNQVVVKPRVPRRYKGVTYVRSVEEEGDADTGEEEVDDDTEGESEEEEPGWVKAAREPVFACQPKKGNRGKKGGSDRAVNGRFAAEKAETSDEDDDSADDEEDADADAMEQQEQEQELKKKEMTRSGKRANTEVKSEEEEDEDDVVVPSRKRARK